MKLEFFAPDRFRKIYIASFLILFILCFGTFGFYTLGDHFSIVDALYMTVITISTVGFGEVHPLDHSGKIFTVFLIISSFGTFAYSISVITSYIIDGEFQRYFKSYKVQSEISKIKGHVIICGYGRNGSQAISVLESHRHPYIVIESNPDRVDKLLAERPKALVVQGDATTDEALTRAGIEQAKALIASLPSDSANLFIVLSGRELNRNLKIISRASEDSSYKKLKRAGADNIIMPDKIGGGHMASLVMKPDVIEFMDYLSAKDEFDINLEEITFESLPADMQNKSIQELNIRSRTGANIIGMKAQDGAFRINPAPEEVIVPGAKLFVLGTVDQIKELKTLFS